MTSATQRFRAALGRVVPRAIANRIRAHLPRRWTVESVITHEGALERTVRRAFTNRKPTLHHLDVHVVDHCNLACKGCEHYSAIADPAFAELPVVVRDLERLADLFDGIEQTYLLGGEPLLHPDVASFVTEARRILPDTRLSLMTNGILVTRMAAEVWDALREAHVTLMVDSYPISIDHVRIDELGVEHGVRIDWMPPNEEFYKIPIDLGASADPRISFEKCRGVANCAIVREGRIYPCAHIAYADILIEKFGLTGIDPTNADSVDIHGDVSGDDIIDALTRPAPWCAHCDFDSFSTYAWGRSTGDASEWISTKGTDS